MRISSFLSLNIRKNLLLKYSKLFYGKKYSVQTRKGDKTLELPLSTHQKNSLDQFPIGGHNIPNKGDLRYDERLEKENLFFLKLDGLELMKEYEPTEKWKEKAIKFCKAPGALETLEKRTVIRLCMRILGINSDKVGKE